MDRMGDGGQKVPTAFMRQISPGDVPDGMVTTANKTCCAFENG